MRRRQIYAAQAAGTPAPVANVVAASQSMPRIEPNQPEPAPPPDYKSGPCRICGKEIKKGMFFHMKTHEKEKHGHQRLG